MYYNKRGAHLFRDRAFLKKRKIIIHVEIFIFNMQNYIYIFNMHNNTSNPKTQKYKIMHYTKGESAAGHWGGSFAHGIKLI